MFKRADQFIEEESKYYESLGKNNSEDNDKEESKKGAAEVYNSKEYHTAQPQVSKDQLYEQT